MEKREWYICPPDCVSHEESSFSVNSGNKSKSSVFAPPGESVVTGDSVVSEVFAPPGDPVVSNPQTKKPKTGKNEIQNCCLGSKSGLP